MFGACYNRIRTYLRYVLLCVILASFVTSSLLVLDGFLGTKLLVPVAISNLKNVILKNSVSTIERNNHVATGNNVQQGNGDDYDDDDHAVYYVDDGVDEQPVFPDAVYDVTGPDAPGENGTGVTIEVAHLDPKNKQRYLEGFRTHNFNQYVSDMISLHRSLPDNRPSSCPIGYSRDLPSTSIIICFHNEAWSVLLRTVHSVLDRTPPYLIKEILLVDDFSTMDHLKAPLAAYMKTIPKVRILRMSKREGLIRARLFGVDNATAPVLTFLDSHVECFPGCLEPMLDRVARNDRTLVSPNILPIRSNTFALEIHPLLKIGVFKLTDLTFDWRDIPQRELKRVKSLADPIRTPTIAGGLFSINRQYFNQVGRYDEGMDIWGMENIELSVRVWTCGGTVETHPCSSFGHVFRRSSPYTWDGKAVDNVLRKNKLRFAEVWLDEYKHGYCYDDPTKPDVVYGDVSDRKRLRTELQCKPFQWYIDHVYPEMQVPPVCLFKGELRHVGEKFCLTSNGAKVFMMRCRVRDEFQLWRLTDAGELMSWKGGCMELSEDKETLIYTHHCSQRNIWKREQDDRLRYTMDDRCLQRYWDITVGLEVCSKNKPMQIWDFVGTDL